MEVDGALKYQSRQDVPDEKTCEDATLLEGRELVRSTGDVLHPGRAEQKLLTTTYSVKVFVNFTRSGFLIENPLLAVSGESRYTAETGLRLICSMTGPVAANAANTSPSPTAIEPNTRAAVYSSPVPVSAEPSISTNRGNATAADMQLTSSSGPKTTMRLERFKTAASVPIIRREEYSDPRS